MKISAKVRKYDGDYGLKGFADVTIEGAFVVKGLTIKESQGGELYVQMPSRKCKPYEDKQGNTKEYEDTFFPISAEARKQLFAVVLAEFTDDGDDEHPF